ncbi:RNA-dependent RNA polymerase [Lates calcarifer birnavirus]|uniref:RNA-directed RNA polymerase n=2 Tax=Birnaviridae TaxID=10993 RepID=A0A4P8PJ90_9VIRU|nr:RNA-dependent RNA polymerase [Lates calcarifer birnavirus]QCQ84350.1 RNA-dependent RNA polymerase [Lates calcarifer birnavirus]
MSDIFNTAQGRSKILASLKLQNVTENTQDWLLPPRWDPPADTIRNSKEAAEALKAGGYRMLKPRSIPEHQPIPTAAALPSLAVLVEMDAIKDEIELPGGDTEYLPRYYPMHKPEHGKQTEFGMYDLPLLKQMTFQLINGKENPAEEGATFKQFRDTILECQYGSGTNAGQIARLLAMRGVAVGRNPNKTLAQQGLTLEQMAVLLEQTLPIGQPGDDETGWPALTTTLSGLLNPDTNEDYLPDVTKKSSAGLPYIGKTKGDTMLEALAIGDTFLRELSAVLSSTTPDQKDRFNSLLQDFWFLSCGLLFPKGERYDRDAWLTKTRNIWSAPFPTHFLISAISWPIMKQSKNNTLNMDTPSLYGFNPFNGGLDSIMRRVEKGEDLHLIYADNIYILQDRIWFSIDLEKGEANATKSHAQAIAYYLLTRGWVQDDGSPAFNATWATLAMQIAPALVVDSSCLFMNLQLKTYGQGSGNPWTFLINHALSTIVVNAWIQAGKPRPDTPQFMALEKTTGVNFKIERTIPEVPTVALKAKESSPLVGYLGDGTNRPPEKEAPTVDLDLLGWSATYSRLLESWVPVLDKERMLKSAAYPKGLENKELKNQPGAELAYTIVRNEALRMVGGWAYPLLDRSLKAMVSAKRNALTVKGIPIESMMGGWQKMTEFSEAFEGIDASLEVTPEFLANMNKPRGRKQPHVNKLALDIKNMQQASTALTSGAFRNPNKMAGLKLNAMAKSKLMTTLQAFKEAEAAADQSGTDDWGEASETLDTMLRASRIYQAEAEASLKDVSEALDSLSAAAANIKTQQEKDTDTISNPVVGYHVPAQRSLGVLSSVTGVGPAPVDGRSKNARKMAKRRSRK